MASFPSEGEQPPQTETKLGEGHLRKNAASSLCLFLELTEDSHQAAGQPSVTAVRPPAPSQKLGCLQEKSRPVPPSRPTSRGTPE